MSGASHHTRVRSKRRHPRYRPSTPNVHYRLCRARTAGLAPPEGQVVGRCVCGQVQFGSEVEVAVWFSWHRRGLAVPTVEHVWRAWVFYLLRVAVLGRWHDAHRTVTATAREGAVLASAGLRRPRPPLARPDLHRSTRAVVEACGHARRTAAFGVDYTRACLRAPKHHSFVNGDGELIEIIRTRRDGRPGWVRVDGRGPRGSLGRAMADRGWGNFYPSITGASGLSRFWVGGSGTWDASTTTNWSATSGGAGGASAPDAGDDAFVNASSGGGTITISAAVCRSLDCTGAPVTTVAFGSSTLNVGDGSGGAFKLVANITVTNTAGTLTFKSTSNNGGTGWAITTAGKTLPGTTIDGVGGKWVLQDAATFAAALTVTNGGFFGNGKTIVSTVISSSNGNVRTLDITNCTITLSAASGWSGTNSTNLTFVSTGSTITFSSTAAAPTLGTLSFATVVFSGFTNQGTFSGGATFANLTLTGAASKTSTFNLQATITVTGTFTVGGNTTQGVNRLLVFSNSRGQQRTINCTGAAVVISGDVDFMDVAPTGSPSWTNAGSKWVGDAGGNGSLITSNATVAATQTHTASAGGNYSDPTKWTSRVPLPQDNVIVNASTTGTLTNDMPRLGADHTFTGFAGTFAQSTTCEVYGSLTYASGMTVSGTGTMTLAGRSSHTLTTATRTLTHGLAVTNGGAGTYTLQDAFTSSRDASTALNVNSGTLATGNNAVALTAANGAFAMTGTATLTVGTATWTFSATAAVTFFTILAGNTATVSGLTVVLGATSASTRTFAGGGKTYGTLTYTVAGSTGTLAITGSNSWSGTWNLSDATNNRVVTVTSGTTQTFTSTGSFFAVTGTAGKITTLASTSPGSAFTLTKTSGAAVVVDYVSVTDSTATGGLWVDGTHYTNGGGNTGWTFADALLSGAETGAGADAGTVSLAFSAADIGAGADDGVVSAAFSAADTGAGVDGSSLAASSTDADLGAAADAGTVTASAAGTEQGAGIETGSLTAAPAGADLGAAADTAALVAGLAGAETGTGTDAAGAAAELDGGDTGTGADTGSPGPVAVTGPETATGDETAALAASLSAAEAGSGIDAADASAALSGSESGLSEDSGAVATAASGADLGQGADQGALALDLLGSESAVAAEFASIVATLAGAETGAGADRGTGGVLVVGSDTGAGVDGSSVRLAVLLLEVGQLLERWSAGPLEPAGWGTRGIIGRITAGP